MIEIQCARGRHSVIRCQDYLSAQSSDGSRRRHDDDLVKAVDDVISCEHQNGPTLIWKPKGIPADLAALHPRSSQPSASQASSSSSAENSSREGGTAR